jgi:hypothetical protein
MSLRVRLSSRAEQGNGLSSLARAKARLFARLRIVNVKDAAIAAIEPKPLLHRIFSRSSLNTPHVRVV